MTELSDPSLAHLRSCFHVQWEEGGKRPLSALVFRGILSSRALAFLVDRAFPLCANPAAPEGVGLRSVSLTDGVLDVARASLLAEGLARLTRLEVLTLARNDMGDDEIEVLLLASRWPALTCLELNDNQLSSYCVTLLVSHAVSTGAFQRLNSLDVGGNVKLADEALVNVGRHAQRLPALKWFCVSRCSVSSPASKQLLTGTQIQVVV